MSLLALIFLTIFNGSFMITSIVLFGGAILSIEVAIDTMSTGFEGRFVDKGIFGIVCVIVDVNN